jgi:putative oxidoreductase
MKRRIIIEVICSMLIFLFVYAASNKLLDYNLFKAQLHFFPLLSFAINFMPWILPLTELIVAALLFIPVTRLYGFFGSALLLTIFTVYLTVMVATQNNLPCSCGGVLQSMSWKQHIVFNIGFILLSATGIVLMKKQTQNHSQ